MSTGYDGPVGVWNRPEPPTRSVRIAAEYLADTVDRDCGTLNGRTALYWHLMAVILQHAGHRPSEPTLATTLAPGGPP